MNMKPENFPPDVVDRMFDLLLQLLPEIAQSRPNIEAVKDEVRKEFAGQEVYIPARSALTRVNTQEQVLQLWNGRNASTVARTLGISRASVYRFLKQAG